MDWGYSHWIGIVTGGGGVRAEDRKTWSACVRDSRYAGEGFGVWVRLQRVSYAHTRNGLTEARRKLERVWLLGQIVG